MSETDIRTSEARMTSDPQSVPESAGQRPRSFLRRWQSWLLLSVVMVVMWGSLELVFTPPLDRAITNSGGRIERQFVNFNYGWLLNRQSPIIRRSLVTLRGEEFDDDWIRSHLSELQEEESLELTLVNVPLTPEGYRLLSTLRNLTNLAVRNSPFDNGCLQELQAHPSLAHMHFVGTQLRDADLEILAKFPRCRFLGIDGALASDAGFGHLRNIPSLMGLTLYEADNDQIALAAQIPGMRHLNLYGTGVTDACIPTLQAMPTLDAVQFFGTSLTADGEDALRNKIAGTHIFSISAQHPEWYKVEEQLGIK